MAISMKKSILSSIKYFLIGILALLTTVSISGVNIVRFFGWDDSEIVRLTSCISRSVWQIHTWPSLECLHYQWRSPILQILLSFTPFTNDMSKFATRISISLAILSSIVLVYLFTRVLQLQSITLRILSVLFLIFEATKEVPIFTANLIQVDGLFTLMLLVLSLELTRLNTANSFDSNILVRINGILAFLILCKFTILPLALFIICSEIFYFRKWDTSLSQLRLKSILSIVAPFFATLLFLALSPSTIIFAISASFGHIRQYFTTVYAISFGAKLDLMLKFKVVIMIGVCILLAHILLNRVGKFKTRIVNAINISIIVGFLINTISILTAPQTDSHYLQPFIASLVFFMLLLFNRFTFVDNFDWRIIIGILMPIIFVLLGYAGSQVRYHGLEHVTSMLSHPMTRNAKYCLVSDSVKLNGPIVKLGLIEANWQERGLQFENLSEDPLNGVPKKMTLVKMQACDYVFYEKTANLSSSYKNINLNVLKSYLKNNFELLEDNNFLVLYKK